VKVAVDVGNIPSGSVCVGSSGAIGMLVAISPQQYLNEQRPLSKNWIKESSPLELVRQPCNMSRSIQRRNEERGNPPED
jgi:adenylosuccinate synthase